MPARKKPRYYSTKDISEMLSVSRTRALERMHMFRHLGQVLQDGKIMRVRADALESWIEQHMVPAGKIETEHGHKNKKTCCWRMGQA